MFYDAVNFRRTTHLQFTELKDCYQYCSSSHITTVIDKKMFSRRDERTVATSVDMFPDGQTHAAS